MRSDLSRPFIDLCNVTKTDLTDLSVDHLVGDSKEEAGYFDPERLRSL